MATASHLATSTLGEGSMGEEIKAAYKAFKEQQEKEAIEKPLPPIHVSESTTAGGGTVFTVDTSQLDMAAFMNQPGNVTHLGDITQAGLAELNETLRQIDFHVIPELV